MSAAYDPKTYWDARLTQHGGLRATGHISFGERYNQWLYRAKSRALERALEGYAIKGRDVLDVGCGSGYFVRWYRDHGARVTGIDISAAAIERLRKEHPGEFHVMDLAAAEPRPIGRFAIVNVWDVLYHVVDDDAFERALRFLAANVGDGGMLLITDRLGAPADVRLAEHVRMRSLNSYQRVLTECGLQASGQQFLYRWLNRYVSVPVLDSQLGRFYYWLDGRETTAPANNLSLGVWRRS